MEWRGGGQRRRSARGEKSGPVPNAIPQEREGSDTRGRDGRNGGTHKDAARGRGREWRGGGLQGDQANNCPSAAKFGVGGEWRCRSEPDDGRGTHHRGLNPRLSLHNGQGSSALMRTKWGNGDQTHTESR
jgi:hypothetical protein